MQLITIAGLKEPRNETFMEQVSFFSQFLASNIGPAVVSAFDLLYPLPLPCVFSLTIFMTNVLINFLHRHIYLTNLSANFTVELPRYNRKFDVKTVFSLEGPSSGFLVFLSTKTVKNCNGTETVIFCHFNSVLLLAFLLNFLNFFHSQ